MWGIWIEYNLTLDKRNLSVKSCGEMTQSRNEIDACSIHRMNWWWLQYDGAYNAIKFMNSSLVYALRLPFLPDSTESKAWLIVQIE